MLRMLNSWYLGGALANSVRAYSSYRSRPGFYGEVMRKACKLRHFLLSVITSSDLDPAAKIGERLRLPHPNGVVIHGNAVIGNDCMIMQQVTIGQLSGSAAPVVGSNVYIGAGAKVLGEIVIGDGAQIGANAVVLCDVPPDWTAVGVPARLVEPRNFKRR
jgi:serine O-acetyltransferase